MSSLQCAVTIDDPIKDSNGAVWSGLVDEHSVNNIFHFPSCICSFINIIFFVSDKKKNIFHFPKKVGWDGVVGAKSLMYIGNFTGDRFICNMHIVLST